MLQKWKFRFAWPNFSAVKQLSAKKPRRQPLGRGKPREAQIETELGDLAHSYRGNGRNPVACGYVARLIESAGDPHQAATCYLSLGQLMEHTQQYTAAFHLYTEALLLETMDQRTRYFLHNKVGVCLNQFGRHVEAELFCRRAIAIAPERHNAYKNLGVSLQGQGQLAEAARCFITAALTNAADPRALRHLEELSARHPELTHKVAHFERDLQTCQLAVRTTLQWHQPLPRR